MSWEIAVGIATLIGALSASLEVILRVNRSLVSLESAVNQLLQFMTGQSEKNYRYEKMFHRHEERLLLLEAKNPSSDSSHFTRKEDLQDEGILHENAADERGSRFFQDLV